MAGTTKLQAPAKPRQPMPAHGIEVGDHVYVHHPAHGPMSVRVTACGRDGLTGKCDQGQRHQVTYDRVLGHRARMLQDWRVVDQGADGAILEDHQGKRRFLKGQVPTLAPSEPARSPAPAADDPLTGGLEALKKAQEASGPMQKAMMLFLKGGSIANRPGLTLKDTTDKSGHQTKRWTRLMQDQPGSSRPAGAAAAGAAGDKAPAAFRHGDTARFRHGDVEGEGKIVASGQHGVTLQAQDGSTHKVRHEHLVRPEGAAEQTPQFPERDPAHTDKEHAKRIARETPDPQHLPEEHGAYFNTEKATHTVPLDKVKSGKTEAETAVSGRNAARLMHAARHGALGKRDPVQAKMGDDGTFHVEDGNSTVAAARKHGWKEIPVTVAGHPTRADAQNSIFSAEDAKDLPKVADQPFKDQKSLYGAAPAALDHLQTWLDRDKGVAVQLGYQTMTKGPEDVSDEEWSKPGGMLFIAPLKGEKRAAEKVEADYGGDWSQLRDVVRCTLAIDSMDDLRGTLEALKKNGLKLAQQPKDRFAKPLPVGYRDALMNVVLPGGMIGEVQLHVKGMLRAKNEGHKLYETERSLDAKEAQGGTLTAAEEQQRQQVQEQQRALYNGAWRAAAGGAAPQEIKKAMDDQAPDNSPDQPDGEEEMAKGGFSFFERGGAYFRRKNAGSRRSVDDVLHQGKWVPYRGADKLHPALYGEEVEDPLAGEMAGRKAEKPLRKAMILFPKAG